MKWPPITRDAVGPMTYPSVPKQTTFETPPQRPYRAGAAQVRLSRKLVSEITVPKAALT